MRTKICGECRKRKSVEEFSVKLKATGVRSSKCKQCSQEYSRKHYKNNSAMYKAKAVAYTKQATVRARDWVFEYLAKASCLDCGNADFRVLEFDHVRDSKTMTIAKMMVMGRSIKAIQEEVNKCEVVCSNCHRIRTQTRQNSWRMQRGAATGTADLD